MIEEEKENPKIKSFLENLGRMFGKKKEIERVRVVTTKQSFWVSNPEKIKFWKNLSETQSRVLLFKPDAIRPSISITKVIYKGEKK